MHLIFIHNSKYAQKTLIEVLNNGGLTHTQVHFYKKILIPSTMIFQKSQHHYK